VAKIERLVLPAWHCWPPVAFAGALPPLDFPCYNVPVSGLALLPNQLILF